MMSRCGYAHSGWSCRDGLLWPEGLAAAPMTQPCPQCATGVFLDLAWQRAQRVNAACGCNTCMPKRGLGTAGFKMAVSEAMRVNPGQCQDWLLRQHVPVDLGI